MARRPPPTCTRCGGALLGVRRRRLAEGGPVGLGDPSYRCANCGTTHGTIGRGRNARIVACSAHRSDGSDQLDVVATARRRVTRANVARLATVRPDGSPRVAPCWFVLDGDVLYTAVDDLKPKSTLALGRIDDVRATERVSLLVDQDDRDWSKLWWERLDGRARVVDPETEAQERRGALELLAAKYPPYRDHPPPGAVVAVRVERWTTWP